MYSKSFSSNGKMKKEVDEMLETDNTIHEVTDNYKIEVSGLYKSYKIL